jgi:hypothetical protein
MGRKFEPKRKKQEETTETAEMNFLRSVAAGYNRIQQDTTG